ncbi:MAG: hypothetical protein RL748_1907 [Pseudomonadota bacterium]
MRILYSLAWYLALPLVCLRLWWRGRREPGYREHWGERFGRFAHFQQNKLPGAARLIWLHAVSVGETRAAQPLLVGLLQQYPGARILLTLMTPTGRATGKTLFADYGERIFQSYLPYDTLWLMRRFIRHFRPDLCILLETEVWPNLLAACAREHVPCALVNARLSERSLKKGLRLGRLMRDAVQCIDLVMAQTRADAERIATLGVRKVVVTGSIKFDVAVPQAQLTLGQALRAAIGKRPVLLCASTREGEEALLLPELSAMLQAEGGPLLLLVPRHPQRFDEVAKLVQQQGLRCQRRSTLDLDATARIAPSIQVLLGDSMGEMFAYYASCDVALIGGSLLPLGGQNLIEACVLAKPVLFGPHMFNFAEISSGALQAGAALALNDAADAAYQMQRLLDDPELAEQLGTAGRDFAMQHQGATRATLVFLATLLP